MGISFERRGSTAIVYLRGELDQHCAGELRKNIDKKVKAEKGISTLVLDLGGVSFMDSSGIGLILGRYKLMGALGGELVLTNAEKQVDKLLKLSGVYSLLDKRRREKKNG